MGFRKAASKTATTGGARRLVLIRAICDYGGSYRTESRTTPILLKWNHAGIGPSAFNDISADLFGIWKRPR